MPFFHLVDTDDILHGYCENGQAVSLYGDSCHDECPIGKSSRSAMSSNCSKSLNNFCPIIEETSKICMDRVNVSITDYCFSNSEYDKYWNCPKANKGVNFEQCYNR